MALSSRSPARISAPGRHWIASVYSTGHLSQDGEPPAVVYASWLGPQPLGQLVLPGTYHWAGHGRGPPLSKFYEGRASSHPVLGMLWYPVRILARHR